MGRRGLTIEDPVGKIPFWGTSITVLQTAETSRLTLRVAKYVHDVAHLIINWSICDSRRDDNGCFWRRQNWFVNCDCTKNSQNCICRLLSLTTTIWRGCLDLIISDSSASLSSVDTIQSFTRRSPTLLDDSDITASWGYDDWTATPTLTPLLPTTLSKLEDLVRPPTSSTAEVKTPSSASSPATMVEYVTPSAAGMNFDGSLYAT